MRLIPHAPEILSWCLLICLCWTNQFPLRDDQILDLTTTPQSERRSLGVPGLSSGGTTDGRSFGPELYDLPLKAKIDKAELRHGALNDILRLRLQVLNAGTVPFRLPSCVDELKAHGANQTERRTFEFRFEFSGQDLKAPMKTTADVTFTAASLPECSVTIASGAGIHVLVETELPSTVRALPAKPEQVKISALLDEFTLENNRFQVSKQSREIRSNPVPLPDAP